MNCNELNKAVMKIVQQEIEPIVTEYLQQHPEYFHKSSVSGLISNYNITLSFQPDTLKDVATVKPTIFIRLGGIEKCHELNCYDHHPEDMYSVFTINGSTVSNQEIPNA